MVTCEEVPWITVSRHPARPGGDVGGRDRDGRRRLLRECHCGKPVVVDPTAALCANDRCGSYPHRASSRKRRPVAAGSPGGPLHVLVVPNVSVILKWVLPQEEEPSWDRARRMLDAFVQGELALVVPSFWWYLEAGHADQGCRHELGHRVPAFVGGAGAPRGALLGGLGDHGGWAGRRPRCDLLRRSYQAVVDRRGHALVTAGTSFIRRMGPRPGLVLQDNFDLDG